MVQTGVLLDHNPADYVGAPTGYKKKVSVPSSLIPRDPNRKDFHLVKERAYRIRRDGKVLEVRTRANGDFTIYKEVKGGATAATPQSQAQQASAVLGSYLKVAPTKFYAILGTIPTGQAGGGAANVTWQEQIPIIPAFCTAIDLIITLPVTVTIGSADSIQMSPFGPYSAFQTQMTLGGAPPWPYTELTPFHLDELKHRVDYDPSYTGLGGQAPASNANPALTNILDYGPTPEQIGGGGSVSPGAVVSATTSPQWVFRTRLQLQRKRHLLWGAIPFGDPENRPNFQVQLAPMLGTLPEQNLFVNKTGVNTDTVVTNGAATVIAVYHLSYIDLLPPSMQQPPTPAIGYGIQLTPSSPGGQVAGQIFKMTHRTAQVYTAMDHILVNAQLPIRADYFGLWDDQDPQSARWSYDAQVNTFANYFFKYQRDYRRYPQTGVYTAELDDGVFPEVPSVSPYTAYMTPDAAYAKAFNLAVTPAMTTGIRIPTGTTLTAPTYVREYEWGLVRVPY